MNTGLSSGAAKVFGALLCMMNLCLLWKPVQVLGASAFPGMAYCSVPPLAGSGFKPNLLLMMDNSASMYDPAYTDPSTLCIDDTYEFDTRTQQFDRTITYPGYFDQGTMYSYNSNTDAFEAATVTLPAGCSDVNLSYLCVSIDKSVKPQVTTSFIASGKFLNWLTMSKLDIEKKVLTGGKFEKDQNKTSGKLIGETRGCQGKRFVKFTRDATGVTFAVRGPHSSDNDYLYTAGHGGGTRIEIYNKTYNKTACLAAVSDWQNKSSVSDLQRDAGNCLGETNLFEAKLDNLYGKVPSASKVYIDILSNCFGNPTQVLYDNTVLDDCKKRIHGLYENNPDAILEDAQDSICSSKSNHALTTNYNDTGSLIADSTGFLGKWYKKEAKSFVLNSNLCTSAKAMACASPTATISCAACCAEEEAEDYCRNITNPVVTDPLTSGSLPANSAVIPSFILDAGVYTIKGVAGVLRARLSVAAQPTGLIQEFSGDINFGVMSFNDNGAGSECKHLVPGMKNGGIGDGDIPCVKHCMDGTTDSKIDCQQDSDCDTAHGFACRENSQTDGGKVISAIGSPLEDKPPVLGLISSLNLVAANAWTPLAESFYNAMAYFANRSSALGTSFTEPLPLQFNCQKNNVLIVSDGISTADRNADVMGLVAEAVQSWGKNGIGNWMPLSLSTAGAETSPPLKGSYNLDDLAWIGRHKNITDFTQDPSAGNYRSIVALTRDANNNRDSVSTYVVYTGSPCSVYKADQVTCDDTLDESQPEKMMQMTAANGGGRVAVARNPGDMENAFRAMLQQIAAGSGSDPSIVSTGNANGAIFLREQYYPTKSFDGGLTSASWIGEMQSLWYYIDPFLGSNGSGSTIREDTLTDQRLSLRNDKIVNLRYDKDSNRTYASLTADTGSGGTDTGTETQVEFDQLNSLWRAGQKLWERDLIKSPRTLLTPLLPGGTAVNGKLMQFSSNSTDALSPYLNLQTGDPDSAKLIRYVSGFDYPGDTSMRSRTVAITGRVVVANPQDTGVGVWKLGDIISSNPQVESPVPLGSYHLPAPRGYSDTSYADFIGKDDYKNRGMVYVGANDGMLHAFNLGKLDATGRLDGSGNPDPNASSDQQATLLGPDFGKEQWAFIPKQVLPYLKYLAHPNYRHLHYVDGNLTLADVKVGGDPAGTKWSTVLIGGMGLGGASTNSCAAGNDCVQTPVTDPGLGYSSYFALDVTAPGNPIFLWEFSNPGLGYSTTGPAIVRSNAVRTGDTGWYAVFGSGPTGPIDTSKQQFLGRSNQNLTFFVVDLLSGVLVKTIQTSIASAFAGSLVGGAIDADRWNPNESDKSKDDAIYVGYNKNSSYLDDNQVTVEKSTGGVLRIYPKDWSWSEVVKDIGPVTSGIARLQDKKNKNLWLYFGSGRYFFNQDDMKESRYLYGVKEPCYNRTVRGAVVKVNGLDTSCTDQVDANKLNDQTTIQSSIDPEKGGWSIKLAPSTTTLGAERLITNPTAITGGAVFFTTFQPKADPCLLGDSYLWGVTYYTGGEITEGALLGKALVQLGTGGLEEVALSEKIGKDDPRRGPPLPGEAGGVKVVTNSGLKPLKKIIHIQER